METLATQINLDLELEKHFGFDRFKENQKKIVASILQGKHTFVIMPTGGGKSLCYQLPALILPGTALIISPLIALMKNQVDSIRGYNTNEDIAHFLNSTLSRKQERHVRECVQNGTTKILYVAPETLTKEENVEFFRQCNISFVAVDEAHCISEWGHDFRPEYRRIREIIDAIDTQIPVVALTATATPKVQLDIVKNLKMEDPQIYISSFNRTNLYYEVLPKVNNRHAQNKIVEIVKSMSGKSGIVYVQSRKSTEEVAQVLQINDIKALAYHAGLDPKTRSKVQDDFLMERCDVIVATIAFGMGIDKPDVRFVIHYNIPKSIENYYQETGRAGRDGLGGHCTAFFNYQDLSKLEKFLRDKNSMERQMGSQLLQEIAAYAETASCRREFLLRYFGETFDSSACTDMCDNCKNPKKKIPATKEMATAIQVILELHEKYKIPLLVDYLCGRKSKVITDYKFDRKQGFGSGSERDSNFWNSLLRHGVLKQLLHRSIEEYGVLKVTDKGHEFLKNPTPIEIAENHDFNHISAPTQSAGGAAVLDDKLYDMLKDTRRRISKQKNIPPYVIFQDPSLEEMASRYPTNMEQLSQLHGISQGKAAKYGKPFIELIADYVKQNDIETPDELLIKQVANKSKKKVHIIQGIDRKLPLEDIARSNDLEMHELLHELYQIVSAGTKVNIDYYIQSDMDEYMVEDIIDYFMESETDDLNDAYEELKDDEITVEEIEMVRIKFLSDHAN